MKKLLLSVSIYLIFLVSSCANRQNIVIPALDFIQSPALSGQKVKLFLDDNYFELDIDQTKRTFSGNISIKAGTYHLKLIYSAAGVSGPVDLASYESDVSIEKNKKTFLNIDRSDFNTSYDDDNDGATNLREVVLGSDPKDPGDLPDNLIRVPNNLPTIQSAINFASEGDIIEVRPNTTSDQRYQENIIIKDKKNLIIRAAIEYIKIRKDPDKKGPIVTFEQSMDITFSGFDIRSGSATSGGGISIINSKNITLEDLWISDNEADSMGGGIYLEESTDVFLTNGIITVNNCNKGAAIAVYRSDFTGNNLLVYKNFSGFTGGIWATESDVSINHSTIYENGGYELYSPKDPAFTMSVTDSIIYSTEDEPLPSEYSISFSHSCLWSGQGDCPFTDNDPDGNICKDPEFNNPSSDDFSLSDSSPAKGMASDGKDMGYLYINGE